MARFSNIRSFGQRSLSNAHRQWKLSAFDTALACATALVGVVLLVALGALSTPEQFLYDLRTRHASFGRPAPTTRLVHLDMDEASLRDDELGRWPWPREDQAALLDEIAVARPKAVAIDVIYSETQKVETRKLPEGGTVDVDHDALFEAALRNLGCAIIGSSQDEAGSGGFKGPIYDRLVALMMERRPFETSEQAVAALGLGKAQVKEVEDDFLAAREDAIGRRTAHLMRDADPGEPAVTLAITGDATPSDTDPVGRLVHTAYVRARGARAILRSRFPPSRDAAAASLYAAAPTVIPLERFSDAAAEVASVSYLKTGDGSLRNIPLVTNIRGQAAVSLGLALAIRTLDVPLSKLDLREDHLIIPAPGGTIDVPLRTERYDTVARPVGGVMDLAWIGPHGADAWQKMYGKDQTVSLVRVWQVVQSRRRLALNNEQLRAACLTIAGQLNNQGSLTLEHRKYDPEDPTAWTETARSLVAQLGPDNIAEFKSAKDPGPGKGEERLPFLLGQAIRSTEAIPEQVARLAKEVREGRADLRDLLHDKAILMGWTATGRTDFVTTPLHPAAPGVRIHGMVFNDIMTRNFVRFAPEWLNVFLTLALGGLMMGAVVRHSPLFAAFVAVGFAVAYSAANIYAFGPHAYVLALAGPLAAIGATWSVGSIQKYRLEQKAVERIKKRFATYVDPQLVNYLLANPDKVGLAGERREMTVCFTDLAGFTSISERLGEGTVPLLNRYFNAMFPIIRRHSGYINKLMGDGMMFFYNGITPNPRHAADCFDTVLDLQAELRSFNAILQSEGLTTVKMRVGISTGHMIAGDAGGSDFADFTVLGDIVNLASRLEGANKKSGTLIICNAAARDAAGPDFVTRPIGTIRVVGKTQGIEAFEVVGRRADSTPEQAAMAERTVAMIAAFRAANLRECERIAETVLPVELGELYLHQCADLRKTGIPKDFDGTITLDAK